MNICVYGASRDGNHPDYVAETERLGRLLAQRGHTIIYGGGATGLMGAIARGAKQENGHLIGIAPDFFDRMDGELFDDCDEMLYTETMRERKRLMQQKSDAFLILPGGTGTFDEFFETIVLKSFNLHPKPVLLFNINGYYDKLWELMEFGAGEGFIAEETNRLFSIFDSVEELVVYLEVSKML